MKRQRAWGRKLHSRRGMTLTELLAAILVMGLLGTAIGAGMPAALRVYRQATAFSESEVLASTLSQVLADELRYATNIEADGSGQMTGYDSLSYGVGAQLIIGEESGKTPGQLLVQCGGQTHALVGARTYTSGLTVKDLSVAYEKELCTVTLVITDGANDHTATFTVRPLNKTN